MSWYPVPQSLLFNNAIWRALTTTAKVLLLSCISEANAQRGAFYRTNDEFRVRLGGPNKPIALHTLLSARSALSSFMVIEPGTRRGARSLATTYNPDQRLWSPQHITGHWSQQQRFMFDTILYRLGCDAALTYTYLAAEYWRCRDRYSDRKEFTIELGEMKHESGLRDFYRLIQKLHNEPTFSHKSRLFSFAGARRIRISDWRIASEEMNEELEAIRESRIRAGVEKLKSERAEKADSDRALEMKAR